MQLPSEQTEQIISRVQEAVSQHYDQTHPHLLETAAKAKNGGQIREASRLFVEDLLQCIFDTLNQALPEANINSLIGSQDFLSRQVTDPISGKSFTFSTIQVDRHIWAKGKRIAFIENKTYLDSCYYDRALADFRKIAQALAQSGIDPASCLFIIFAGQNSLKQPTLQAYTADFINEISLLVKPPASTHIIPHVVFFLQEKRKSTVPLYRRKIPLNLEAIAQFTRLLLEQL